ncbi:UNVERIFIED_CONTAM: hypothetical protein FKN15_059869 [Acipenser sinensis]
MTAGVLQLRSSSTKMASDCMTMLYVMKIVPGTITMKKVVALEEEVALGIKEDSGVVLRLNRAVDEAEKEAVGLEEGEEDSSRIMETMILAALVGLEAEEEDLEVVQVMTVVKEEDEEDLAAEDLEVIYVPPPPPEEEDTIFAHYETGINFNKYDDILVDVSGNAPLAIMTFDEAGLCDTLNKNISKSGYVKPTPVQKHGIPIVLGGCDLMACAQTGSGKTVIYVPPPPPEEEDTIFAHYETGINFNKYDDILVDVSGNAPLAIMTFDEAGLCDTLNKNISKSGYVKPTPVQKHGIPIVLGGCDLMACTERTMVFVETKRKADFIATFLCQEKIPTTSIHGDREQREREQALGDFRTGKCPVLVATSVAARGLDIEHVQHVVNFDLPSSIDEYVHRIGRTGRCGNTGKAISFFDPESDTPIARSLVKVLSDKGGVFMQKSSYGFKVQTRLREVDRNLKYSQVNSAVHGLQQVKEVEAFSYKDLIWVKWKTPDVPVNTYIIDWCMDDETCEIDWQYTNTTNVSLNGASEPYQRYNITVSAVFDGKPGTPVSVQTYLKEAAPGPVSDVQAFNVQQTTATIKWREIPKNERHGFITNYTIFYKDDKGQESYVTVNSSVLEYLLDSLLPNTKYIVHVMASTKVGQTNSSETFFTTVRYSKYLTVQIKSLYCTVKYSLEA